MSHSVVLAEQALTVFTDGSSLPAPRRGGIGMRFVHTNEVGEETVFDLVEPGYAGEAVNRMELQAVIVALKAVRSSRLPASLLAGIRRIDIVTDSMYVADNLDNALYNWPGNRWMTRSGAPVMNVDLWKELVREYKRLRQSIRVDVKWAKGHSASNPHNKAVDKLAKHSANAPFVVPRANRSVRRKKSSGVTEPGSVPMLGQRLSIHIIETEYLREQRLTRYRYQVVSTRSQFRGRIDFAFSEDPMMKAGHRYFVVMGHDQGFPKIVRRLRELGI
jgi:ribonuclease HI